MIEESKYILGIIGTLMLWCFFYAYKHPEAYMKRLPFLLTIEFAIYLILYAWLYSAVWHYREIFSILSKPQIDKLQTTITDILNKKYFMSFISGGVAIYMVLLLFVHNLLGTKKGNQEKNQSKN